MSFALPLPIGSDDDIDVYHPNQDGAMISPVERARRASAARNASGRRRLVDPTTCERDYSVAELEFLDAIQEYKRRSGRMFPTWSEVLEVVRSLGYTRPE